MGYCTYYTLTVRRRDGSYPAPDLQRIRDALTEKRIIGYALDRGSVIQKELFFDGLEAVRWYEHEDDMTEISRRFADFTFCLHGDGAQQGDVWNKYFMNGEMEECRMEWHIPEPTTIPW